MKKNKNLKNKICSGFLALVLAGTPLALVKAEEQIIQSEQEIQIMNQANALEDIIRHPHLHKYASEDASEFKWICSEEPIIDGLNWTEETMDFEFSFEASDYAKHLKQYDCPVEGYHQHLYCCLDYGMGTIPKELETFMIIRVVEDTDNEYAKKVTSFDPYYVKTPVVVTYSKQDYQMMKDLQITPSLFNCMYLDLFEKKVSRGNDFKSLMLSINDMGEYYIVDEKLISYDELISNVIEFPYMPNALAIHDTYQPKSDYKVYKKTK